MENSSRAKVDEVIQILQDKKAKDIKVLDIHELSALSDYFVIATGTSTTHVQALCDNVEEKMGEAGYTMHHKEGFRSGRWILLDYYDVVIHIFYEEERKFYNLERLWVDAKTIEVEE
ncbi:ribosome silencing factor [Lutispora sp.]|uniref:ribosome silencing factor n=1 Tax=Lutispora sp. TaxID=2828727 RepID=UPI002B21E83A|nr:ribosome silencing factor [Lutispora sp.]MEA4963118.1 ribosome silencing factor [Lutispora sp.]